MIDALLLALIGGFVYWLCCRAVKYYDNHKKDQSTTNVAMPQCSAYYKIKDLTSEEYVELIKIYGSSALEIIDISDPANPVHAGKIRM